MADTDDTAGSEGGTRPGSEYGTPAVYDHVTPTAEADGTVYRVVGVPDDRVTLLRLTDRDGNREATGEVHQVAPADYRTDYERASDPDPRFDWPEYLGAAFLVGGLGLIAHPGFDILSGGILALSGGYLLWRRGVLSR